MSNPGAVSGAVSGARVRALSTTAAADLVDALAAAGARPGAFLAVSVRPAAGLELALGDSAWSVSTSTPAQSVQAVETALRPRWVWWRADVLAAELLPAGVRVAACWDLAAVHRLIAGGQVDDPAHIWAAVHHLAETAIPQLGQLDLLGLDGTAAHSSPAALDGADDVDSPVLPTGYLRPGCAEPAWLSSPHRSAQWAALALQVQSAQAARLDRPATAGLGPIRPADPLMAARSESAAALLCTELQHDGLPFDRAESARLLLDMIGPSPADESDRLAHRRRRDATVLDQVPGQSADLRNPAQVRELLAAVGISVPDTRSWRLEPFRGVHPVVDALLTWRKHERVETTYGYAWLARNVAGDGRLRGAWQASDGAAGRMTAQAGLHNLPSELRGAVAADPGRVLVRADLGQVEPRVLAAVSGDAALVAATADEDLYTPVAQRLGVERPVAKVAVLAAMYGQTSGAAGEALAGMESSYPTAMGYLREAERAGRSGLPITTYGGRLVRVWPTPDGLAEADRRSVEAARGRFTRNAAVQGAAAELFKAWAATVRLELRDVGAAIVLCLHDELLVHADESDAQTVVQTLRRCLDDTARWWFGSQRTRFVAEVAVGRRWTDTKPA